MRTSRTASTTPAPPKKLTAESSTSAPKARTTGRKDEFSTGRGKALRAKALATVGAPQVGGDLNAAPVAAVSSRTSLAARRPVFSFDTTTYLSKVGNPPELRITQQQVDQLKRMGMEHGVIGMPTSSITGADYTAQMAALKQETTLLAANGIKTDTYLYMRWTQANGQPKTDAQVRQEMTRLLDGMNGLPVKTFWFDVEVDAKLNPGAGVANHQRILDTAYQAFTDWKTAHPESKLEFGIYTGKSVWNEQMVKGPNDPFATKYADLGVPLWQAQYPKDYDLKQASSGLDDMRANLGEGFGGWSVDAGNVRGWQYRAGEHDGHQPTFNYGLDRNVWLDDSSEPAPQVTAFPSGPRSDLSVTNQALANYLAADANKPIDQRKYQSMQNLINDVYAGKTTFQKLGVSEADALRYRWEDPWKAVYGLPLGKDQFSTTPIPGSTTPAPTPVTPPVTTPPVTPPTTPVAGSPIDLIGLTRGSSDAARVKQLQDTLMSLGYLQDIKGSTGYGKSFGPMTETAVRAFQKASALPPSGTVDRATAIALANRTNTPLGFDSTSPFAPTFGLARGANGEADRAAIKQLQDALIAGGYVPASMKTQGGYGTNFGPITDAGLRQFQQDNGLQPTGIVDGATVGALQNPRARTAGFAAGVALAHRAELGLPKGPAYTAADGSQRQDFDHGTVWVGADRVLHAELQTPTGPKDLEPPRKLGTAQSLAEAQQYFLSQWGPTAYNDPVGANDHPWGFEDCGPTSAVMALSALGLRARPGATDASTAIDQMRDTILGYDSTKSLGLSLLPAVKGTVGYGLVQSGAQVTGLTNTVDNVNAAMARGNPVIIGSSTTWDAWGRDQKAAGNYLNSSSPGGHFVVVLGRAANGNYLIGDPLLRGGPIEATEAQLRTALAGAFNSANALAEVSRP
ncbi:MAG: peptidoglycan-binding protein [Myxococcaceae bacterium]